MVNNLINKSKKKHLRHYFQEDFSNAKKAWSKINECNTIRTNLMTFFLILIGKQCLVQVGSK